MYALFAAYPSTDWWETKRQQVNKIDEEIMKAALIDAMESLTQAQSIVRMAIWQLEESEKKQTDEKPE